MNRKEQKDIRQKKHKVVFIITPGHSGATLLCLLLGSAEETVAIGEAMRLDKLQNIQEQAHEIQTFWKGVLQEFKIKNPEIEVPLVNDLCGNEFWYEWFCCISRQSGHRILIEKTPSIRIIKRVVPSDNLDICYINLIRDPRAVYFSYARKGRAGLRRMVGLWRSYKEINAFALAQENVLTIKYEDLAIDPDKSLEYIANFLLKSFNLDDPICFPDQIGRRDLSDGIFDHVMYEGNRMRLQKNREGQKITVDNDYKKELSSAQWWILTGAFCKFLSCNRYTYSRSAV